MNRVATGFRRTIGVMVTAGLLSCGGESDQSTAAASTHSDPVDASTGTACDDAIPLADGDERTDALPARDHRRVVICDERATSPQYYAISIPANERAIVTVTPTGQPHWRAIVGLHRDCTNDDACIAASESPHAGAPTTVTVANDSTSPLAVIVAVGARGEGIRHAFTIALRFEPLSGTACDCAPPRPIAPLSTATVTSRQPTLRWQLAPGTDGARLDLCRDRACTDVLATLDATSDHAIPPAALPPGVVFWRLRGREGAATGTSFSPTWQFTVGHRSAPIDTSWGTTLDVNGDGHADAVIAANITEGTSERGRAWVYPGSATGLATEPATTLTGPDELTEIVDFPVTSAGDVNGDGYGDVVVGAPGALSMTGRAYVYLGSASGLSSTPGTTLTGPDGGQFGYAVASAGDVNGDGYGDLVVGARAALSADGRAYVYLGSASGLVPTPATTLVAPDGVGIFGESVASAGDLDGDHYADLVVGAPAVQSYTGRAYVYRGSASGIANTPSVSLTGPGGIDDFFGEPIVSAGDVNGDGHADFAVGARHAYLYLGNAAGVSPTPTIITDPSNPLPGPVGLTVTGSGDVNGDGYSDLAVAQSSPASLVDIFSGSATGLATVPTVRLYGPGPEPFGVAVARVSDIDGNGFADVFVGDRSPETAAIAYEYLHGAGGIPTLPTMSIVPPEIGSAYFF